MAAVKLTKRIVDEALPSERDKLLWDSALKGFGLKITPAGSKVYIVQYRMGGRGAKTQRVTIGKNGSPWDVAAARLEAERILVQVRTGKDPSIVRQDLRRTTIELAFNTYAARFLDDYGVSRWTERNLKSARSNMTRWIVPVLGRKPLPDITRRDVVAVLDGIPQTSPALRRSAFALIRKLFNHALEKGDIERSPCFGMKGPPTVASRDRVLTDDELLFVLLASTGLPRAFAGLVQMLLVTGQRREEVAGMRWSELDRELREWTIPGARTKNSKTHVVPLSSLAVRLIDVLATKQAWPVKGPVFTTRGDVPISGFSKIKKQLDLSMCCKAAYRELSPWRMHDLRRTLATGLQRLGVRFEVIEAILNHVSGSKSGIAGVYQRHEWALEKREALERWGVKLENLVGNAETRLSSRL